MTDPLKAGCERLAEAIIRLKILSHYDRPVDLESPDRTAIKMTDLYLLIARVETQDRLLAKAQESIQAAFEDGKNRAAEVAEHPTYGPDGKAIATAIRALMDKENGV